MRAERRRRQITSARGVAATSSSLARSAPGRDVLGDLADQLGGDRDDLEFVEAARREISIERTGQDALGSRGPW
jgi:hypothetical protein